MIISDVIDLIKEYVVLFKQHFLHATVKESPKEWLTGTRGDIFIIPGWHGTFHSFIKMGKRLNDLGFKIRYLEDLDTKEGTKAQSDFVVKKLSEVDSDNIILLSYSKGGLVAKYILDNYPEIYDKIRYSVSVATAYRGAIAGFLNFHGLHEMKPKSEVVRNFKPEEPTTTRIYNYYPRVDNLAIPKSSLFLPGAHNKEINVVGHGRILESDELIENIVSLLSEN